MKKLLIVVLGPTASGKTDLAIQLAQYYNTEILSADSRQFYKEISIGTAKPTQNELEKINHHFINNKSIQDNYNVGDFEKDALNSLNKIYDKNDIAVMAGGSGLYIQAVCEGFDDIPVGNESIREEINEQFEKKGIMYLQEKLKELDPVYANKIDIENPQRMKRALEVCLSTGKPFSSFQKGNKKYRLFDIIKVGIDMDKEILYERINKRVDAMIESGLEKEASSVYPFRTHNALQTVGYKEFFEYFDQSISKEEAIEKIKRNTRRYAKRQKTWFRKDATIFWTSTNHFEEIVKYIDKLSTK